MTQMAKAILGRWLAISVLAVLLISLAAVLGGRDAEPAAAHHFDNGHSGYLYPPVQFYEENGLTATGQKIKISALSNDNWIAPVNYAVAFWNTGLSSTTGFDVFEYGFSYYYPVWVDSRNEWWICGYTWAHGCIDSEVNSLWNPSQPLARIYMVEYQFGPDDGVHRISDVMHEMGHVLYLAGEHYPAYGCDSIMSHCPTNYTVKAHDIQDYRDAYGVKDAPNATYAWVFSGNQIKHHWEGSYQGGIGYTLHQEKLYWIDFAENGVTGDYRTYRGVNRIVSNADDIYPLTMTVNEVPPQGGEWCFKVNGQAGGIRYDQPYYWGPRSKAYCVSRDGNNVFGTSDRNGDIYFRVWNYSGSTKSNVKIKIGDAWCTIGSLSNGANGECGGNWAGPGYVYIYYNNSWLPYDTLGFDG